MQAHLVAGGVSVTLDNETKVFLPAKEARELRRWLDNHEFELWSIVNEQIRREDEQKREG